jgi:hypothetical protein
MRRPLLQVDKAFRDFGRKKGQPLSKLTPRLEQSERTLATLRRKLRAVDTPPDARRMQSLLVRLVGQEAGLAHEVVLLAHFGPSFSGALRPLSPATRDLRTAFGKAKTAKAQADALDAYVSALAVVLKRLRPLEAPSALEPALASQRATLAQVRNSAIALSKGLRAKRTIGLPTLIQRFTNAGNASQSLVAQRARITAITAYNARVAELAALARKIDRERLRIEKQFG